VLQVGAQGTRLHLCLDWAHDARQRLSIRPDLHLLDHHWAAHLLGRHRLLRPHLFFHLLLHDVLLVLLTATRGQFRVGRLLGGDVWHRIAEVLPRQVWIDDFPLLLTLCGLDAEHGIVMQVMLRLRPHFNREANAHNAFSVFLDQLAVRLNQLLIKH
jgi:hypothetical protein